MNQDIKAILDQVEHVKTLPIEEQEAWVAKNIDPMAKALQEIGIAVEEMMYAAFVFMAPIFRETVKWYEDNKVVIDKAIANER